MNQELADARTDVQAAPMECVSRSAATSRRDFLGRAAVATAASVAAGALTGLPRPAYAASLAHSVADRLAGAARADQALAIRLGAARRKRAVPLPSHPNNGDEAAYASRIGSYSKGLPHNDLGEVDPAAYDALLAALTTGIVAAFESVPRGGSNKQADPMAAYAFNLAGADNYCLACAPAPVFSSAAEAAEMAELYWQALAHDIPFATYGTDTLIGDAAADLSNLFAFRGPTANGGVTRDSIFAMGLPGELTGPRFSQFLWLPVPYGAQTVPQRYPVAPATEFLTTFADWLAVQRGQYTPPTVAASPTPSPTRYVSTGRDLATYLHADFTYQAYLNAGLILYKLAAPLDAANPYRTAKGQTGVGTFGPHHLYDLVAKVANTAVKAVWYQKWLVHRRLRPEAFGGHVHAHKVGAAHYPLHADLFTTSSVLDAVHRQVGSYLLPMPYPEGSPVHPSYPAAHTTIAGACVTVLKAWFDETAPLPQAVIASADGSSLVPYSGPALTVGGELNKLAANIGMGRAFGGVHWRSDNAEALRLGEAVAISLLRDEDQTYAEAFTGFTLTRFDGTTITV
jgi:hypothetical protein